MPNKEFLEQYPLYRKFEIEVPGTLDKLAKVAVNMPCPNCKSSQTFTMTNEYFELFNYGNPPSEGVCTRAQYLCAHCRQFERLFYI